MAVVYPMKTVSHLAPAIEDDKTYTFASEPRVLFHPCGAARFRQHAVNAEARYGNIMYDRRVVRGTTAPKHSATVGIPPDRGDVCRQLDVRRRVVGRRPVRTTVRRTLSPPPVRGRQHIEVQTELFLEELAATTEVLDEESQTDPFLDRPSTPLFIPVKTGLDAETQIYEGELFNFDVEVVPILEVLVGKTVEQSLLEVMEEEELASIREQQQRFAELRNAELVEQQRMAEHHRRLTEEKNRRVMHHKAALVVQQETATKAATNSLVQNFLADLAPVAFQSLRKDLYFSDPVHKELELAFMPWLMNRVVDELGKIVAHRAIIDGLIDDIVQSAARTFVPLVMKDDFVDMRFEEIRLQERDLGRETEFFEDISGEGEEGEMDELFTVESEKTAEEMGRAPK